MGLSSDLISQFVKITKDKETSKGESTTYGTIVKYNGKTYAKLDGSELLTPVTTTTDVEENERVTVTIKNHTATVTGNISSPSARTDTVKEIDKEVTVIGNKISEFEIVIADKVSTTELDAEKARIDDLTADNVTIKEKLTAAEADIDTLTVDNITIKEKVSASEAEITTIKATNVTISGKVSANEADIDKLTTDYAVVNEKLIANSADIDILEADYATINGKMTAVEADISTLEADNVNINSKLNANEADINNLKANSLTSDSAVIKNLQSDVADIDTLIFGSASGNSIQTSFANAVIAQLGNAQIKSAMIESVSASKITAGDIITNNVRVMSEDGSLIISDETLQISDGARVRVQIGKDAASDYSINIWDASGNLMFSKGGITDAAIKNAIIRNDMVAANANISASKLDIDSLFTEINNSSKTIKSTKVYLDEKGQTLDAAFTSMTTDVNGIRGTVESQGTQISVMQGQIANKIWQTDIDTTIDKLEIGGRNLLRNSRLIKPSSNNAGLYPIGLETVTENNITFYRVTRSSVDLNPTTFSIYNTIGKDSFNHTEMNGKTVVLSFKARASHATKMTLMSYATDPMTTFSKNNASESITTEWMTYTQVVDEFPDMSNMHCVRFSPLNITIPSGVNVSDFYIDVREWKFELGNKATDWTPAPEDVEGEISTLSTKYSEVKQTVDGLSTTVAAHTTQISNKADSSTVTTVNNKVSALEQNLDGFKTTVSSTYATKSALNETNSKLPWQSQGWVDASAYDESLWIPFVSTVQLPHYGYGHIAVSVALNSGTKPSWSSHGSGFSVEFDVEAKSSGWGTSIQEAIINRDTYAHCTVSPVSYKQLGFSSKAVLYLRGGGKYYVYTSWATTWTGFPDGYTWTSGNYSQSAPTSTTRPTPEGYMYGTKTEIRQLSDRITANVSETTALGTRMSTVEQKADGLTVSLSNTQTQLDNLEIGGRNLIRADFLVYGNRAPTSTKQYALGSAWAETLMSSVHTPKILEPSTEYTISCVFECTSKASGTTLADSRFGFTFYSYSIAQYVGLYPSYVGDTINVGDKLTYKKTFTTPTALPTDTRLMSYTRYWDNGSSDGFMVYNLKLEKGNKATDWTPAPEDVDISISNAQTTANTAVTNAANAQSTANTASSKADTAQSTANTAVTNAANAQSTANTANSTANSVKTDLANNYTKKTLPDTRNDNQNPQWYMTNYPRQIITEFKYSSVIGLSGETYCSLTTTVPWTDYSGGYPKQHAKVGSKEYWRVGTSTTAWGSWVDAYGTAQNAAKTATNYLSFSNGGLVVGNMTASTLGNNVLIDTDSVDIRNGTTVLASYKADTIELGKNSPQSIIDLCDGTAQLTNKNTVSGMDWYRLGITSRDEIGLETSGQVAMDTYYETASGESASGVFRLSSSNPWVDQLGVVPMAYISVDHRTSGVRKWSQLSMGDDVMGMTQEYSATDVNRTTIIDVIANSTKSAVEMTTDRLEMLRNNSKIYGVSPNGVRKAVFTPQNQYGNTIIGYENYTNGSGNTNVYGQDISIASSEAGNVSYRPYYRGNGLESSGDTITMKIRTAGFVTNSGQSVQFTVPLAKPIIGNPTVTATSVDGFQLRCFGFYTHGSSASVYAKPDSYSVVTTNGGNNVVITASFSNIANINNNTASVGARNNSAIGIYWSGQLTITFG